jgi:hypothetical protein
VPSAVRCVLGGDAAVFVDGRGKPVARYPRTEVLAYGSNRETLILGLEDSPRSPAVGNEYAAESESDDVRA